MTRNGPSRALFPVTHLAAAAAAAAFRAHLVLPQVLFFSLSLEHRSLRAHTEEEGLELQKTHARTHAHISYTTMGSSFSRYIRERKKTVPFYAPVRIIKSAGKEEKK